MKLDKSIKILVGGGTFWVLFYPLLFIIIWFLAIPGVMFSSPSESSFSMFSMFDLIFPLHCLTAIMQFALMGFYLFHIIKNTLVSDSIRVVFGIGIFFMPIIAMPVYYYFFVWKDSPPKWALPEIKTSQPSDKSTASISENQPAISSKKLATIGGIIAALVLILFVFAFIFTRLINNFNQRIQDQYFSIPTPIPYDNLSMYQGNEKAFYQPVDISLFIPINTFKEIYTWSDFNQIPILISGDNVFVAGHLQELDDTWGSGINVDVISADIYSGKVNWQAIAGSPFLLKDSTQIYAEAPNNFGAAGVVAYDINSGVLAWETYFDYEYAVGVGHLILTESDIKAETYNHGDRAVYTVDLETGEIKDVVKDTPQYAVDEIVIYDDMRFEKQGYGVPDKVTVTNIDNGSIIWEYKGEPVISNIAVGGTTTYFLTENNRLIALNTYTGEVLGELAFAPRFSHDFDFINTSIVVAADGDLVAVYFEDSTQLSVFRFANAVK
ncbi:MAG: hypothetical protein J0L96_03990 [Anaerolineae bacterium]|nr:hypothetical protein [Anaerolineae bacterium]